MYIHDAALAAAVPWEGKRFVFNHLQQTQSFTTMGRKLVRRVPLEKEFSTITRKRLLATVFLQHVLLWSSAYVVASTAYSIHTGAITKELMPLAAVSVFTVSVLGIDRLSSIS